MGLFSKHKKDDDEAIDPDGRSPQLGIKYKDLAMLGQLVDAGADLTKPRNVTYRLNFASEEAALLALTEGAAAGFETEVKSPMADSSSQWALVCRRADAVLSPDFVRGSDDFFQSLADRHHGRYDGWEGSV